jgi:hypothetical protein
MVASLTTSLINLLELQFQIKLASLGFWELGITVPYTRGFKNCTEQYWGRGVERKPMLWISGVGCVRQILLKIRTWMPETRGNSHNHETGKCGTFGNLQLVSKSKPCVGRQSGFILTPFKFLVLSFASVWKQYVGSSSHHISAANKHRIWRLVHGSNHFGRCSWYPPAPLPPTSLSCLLSV